MIDKCCGSTLKLKKQGNNYLLAKKINQEYTLNQSFHPVECFYYMK